MTRAVGRICPPNSFKRIRKKQIVRTGAFFRRGRYIWEKLIFRFDLYGAQLA